MLNYRNYSGPRLFLLALVITSLLAGCNLAIPPAAPPATPTPTIVLPPAVGTVPFSQTEWRTDFSKHNVAWSEILAGGPGKDGIPAIDAPAFDNVWDAQRWLPKQEPVIFFQQGDDARAYPLRILIWHEIVNDVVGGKPVTVTFCPLCNASKPCVAWRACSIECDELMRAVPRATWANPAADATGEPPQIIVRRYYGPQAQ